MGPLGNRDACHLGGGPDCIPRTDVDHAWWVTRMKESTRSQNWAFVFVATGKDVGQRPVTNTGDSGVAQTQQQGRR